MLNKSDLCFCTNLVQHTEEGKNVEVVLPMRDNWVNQTVSEGVCISEL